MRKLGLPFYDAYKHRLWHNTRNAKKRKERSEAQNSKRSVIRARWGMEWHELLKLLHAQGLNKTQCAKAMGYASAQSFYCVLLRNPECDPWCPRTIPMQYFHDTGESFPDAVRRMAAEGLTLGEALVRIGYAPGSRQGMLHAMKQYGVEDAFVRRRAGFRPLGKAHARRLELAAGAPRKKPGPKPFVIRINSEGQHPWITDRKESIAAHEIKKKSLTGSAK